MAVKDFYNFKAMSTHIKNFDFNTDRQKVVWNKFKVIQLQSETPNVYTYKTHHGGPKFQVSMFHRLRSELPNPRMMTLSQIRYEPIPISKQKFADLLSLCIQQIILPVHHAFFLLLPHDTE